MLVLTVENFEKFTIGGNAFQTLIIRSTQNLPEPETGRASRLKQFVLVTSCTTSNNELEKNQKS